YNTSGLLTMIIQEFIQWENYARCMGLAQDDVRVMKYDPHARYYAPEHDFSADMYERLWNDTITICKAFGYDMNTCEFAIRDGVPYAIDFMNPAPDMDVNSLGKGHFDWMVTHMADNMIKLALSSVGTRDSYSWGNLATSAKAPKKKSASKAKGG
ncbi:MAG TPA: hypothetical protein PLZ51_22640, partial [Aggregatilineales bacterium]|nr:hypothetical protein [Aggregatilineales bacterium]